jgi:multiple sugar transport system substrate-binding protein
MLKKLIPLILSVMLLSFFGCGKGDAGKKIIRLGFRGTVEEGRIMEAANKKWQKIHPDIKVVLENTSGDYVSKVLPQAAGNTAPDVIFAEVMEFVPFVSKGLFLSLNDFIKADTTFNIKDYFPEVVGRYTVNDQIYCIPRDTAPFACVYYNKKLFDQQGVAYPKDSWTMDEFLETAKKLTLRNQKDKSVIQYGYYGWTWLNFIYAFGGKVVDNVKKPTRCLMDSPEAVKGLQFYADLCNVSKVMPTPIAIQNVGMGASDMFMTGRLAMFGSGIWETPRFRSIKDFDWDIAMFPKGPSGIRGFGTGGSGYCINAKTKYPQEAWLVLKYFSGEAGQINNAETGLAQPALINLAKGEYWAKSKEKPLNKGMLNDAVKYTVYEPFIPSWVEARQKYVDPQLDKVFNGEITAAQFAQQVVPLVNKSMFEKQ